MAGVKISQLPAVASALATDFFPVVQGGVTSQETLAQVQTLFGFTGGILGLAAGGTNADLSAQASNGGIVWSNATQMQILAGTATARRMLQSGASVTPAWSTATWPATTTINQLLYSSSANTVVGLATAASGVLVTSAGGVPSISASLPGGLTVASDPTVALGIATKQYVDLTALNGTSVYAASTGTLGTVTQSGAGVGATLTNAGAQATFALDGVNPPAGSNVLIKDTSTGATAANEGIYTVTSVGSGSTNWVLTRATSYDTVTEINNTGLIVINNGSTLAGQAWYNSATIVTVDTTNFNFSRFGSTGTVTSVSGAGLATGTVTTSGSITVTAAVKSDQQAGTSTTTAVTPAVQQFHPSAIPAWAQVTQSAGTYTLQGSYNVTSITKNGTGDVTLNITNAFSATGNMVPTTTSDSSPDATHTQLIVTANTDTSHVRVLIYNVNIPGSPALMDFSGFRCIVAGTLA